MKKILAFTLIELSIVLVIIGLIIGGVLVGRDLYNAATVRSQLKQVEDIGTSIYTFRLKYNCLPGDCANAVALGLGTNAAWHNGDNDGKISTPCGGPTSGVKEQNNFFYHLSLAGLTAGTYQGYDGTSVVLTDVIADARYMRGKIRASAPSYLFPSYLWGEDAPGAASTDCDPYDYNETRYGGNGLMLAGVGGPYFVASVSAPFVKMMDGKIDDGLPRTGNKLGIANSFWSYRIHVVNDTDGNGKCSNGTSNAYLTTATTMCKPVFLNLF